MAFKNTVLGSLMILIWATDGLAACPGTQVVPFFPGNSSVQSFLEEAYVKDLGPALYYFGF